MSFKFCPECGAKLEVSYRFCHECGFALRLAEQPATEKPFSQSPANSPSEGENDEFTKSVLNVAEMFFSMSEKEQKEMIDYAQERCRQAEMEAQALNSK